MQNNNKKDFCPYTLTKGYGVYYINKKTIAYCKNKVDQECFMYNIDCMNSEQHRLNEPVPGPRFTTTRMIDVVMNTILDITVEETYDLFMDKLRCLLAEDIITKLKATDPKSLPTYFQDHLNLIKIKLKQLN